MIPRWTTRLAAGRDRATTATRLRDWRTTFVDALAAARKSGHAAEIAREGALLDPDAALGGGPIPNGDVPLPGDQARRQVGRDCSIMSPIPPSPAASAPSASCSGFAKLTGSQRQVGLIFPGDAMRQVFLGTLVLGDERAARCNMARTQTRDVAGYRRADRPRPLAAGACRSPISNPSST